MMLKLKTDFILVIFVFINDFYKTITPDCVKFRSNIYKPL